MPPSPPTREEEGERVDPPETAPNTAHLRQELHALFTEMNSLESQKTAYMLRTMTTPLSLLYASTYAICLKVRPFGGGETLVHQLMIGAAVVTFLLVVSVTPVAYFTEFDLTRPFGLPMSRVLFLLLALIAAIMTVVTAMIFAFIVQWAFHDDLHWNANRRLQMPVDCATHGAVLLSLEVFCIFLYVLLALRIYYFVLSDANGTGGGGGGHWDGSQDKPSGGRVTKQRPHLAAGHDQRTCSPAATQ
ncbi:hypothetical protein TYRP_000898 [Tyrophagus putrescentiae]|nr:hypothetical protein TYRP_000898 [Tyrophagus putrescentiae]